ncbi:hypothetical protein AB6A40_006442 [Gnathostoma spinigerum]|uniref:C2H2-type domain-containing protein n=1 Tax=Gnathostoma spinigerum TaxID=75299 RepID=A0ABD6EID9_9BILA
MFVSKTADYRRNEVKLDPVSLVEHWTVRKCARAERSVNGRNQQFLEMKPLVAVRAIPGGSLTNGQPVVRVSSEKCLVCNYCQLKFPNEAGLAAHETRCSRRSEIVRPQPQPIQQIHHSMPTAMVPPHVIPENSSRKQGVVRSPISTHENRFPLKKRILAAIEHLYDEEQAVTSKMPKMESKADLKEESCLKPDSFIPITCSSPLLNIVHSTSAQGSCQVTVVKCEKVTDIPVTTSIARNRRTSAMNDSEKRIQPTALSLQVPPGIDTEKPYILTLNDSSVTRNDALMRRRHLRNITTETLCLKRPQPMFVEYKPKLSMYSNWQQTPVTPEEAKFNILYMGACSSKPCIGVKQHCRYTTASREMGALRVTHSSFWDYSTKMRLRQNAVVTAVNQAQNIVHLSPSPSTAGLVITQVSQPCNNVEVVSPNINVTSLAVGFTTASSTVQMPSSSQTANATRDDNISAVRIDDAGGGENQKPPSVLPKTNTACRHIVGGYCADEVYVYVRGRGRGRYVCDRCGIRCKKPSMLKKHIKSHTDIRPFKCSQCNFSFKTKGNLTKHLQSKSHRRRLAESQSSVAVDDQESDSDHDRLEIASSPNSSYSNDLLSDDECSSDDEAQPNGGFSSGNVVPYRKFGQENILIERATHTPPTLWMVGKTVARWPEPDHSRVCHSAPPSNTYVNESHHSRKIAKAHGFSSKHLHVNANDEVNSGHQQSCVNEDTKPNSVTDSTLGTHTRSNTSNCGAVQSSAGAFFAKEELACEMCERTFRKAAELTLHRHAHLLEQQNSRTRSYQCTECKQTVRSKNLLSRHMETAHPNVERKASEVLDSDIEESIPAYTQNVNPRSFVCSDCNIGFRKHGILAKHLRSKTHVQKLESLGKLPDDALFIITRKENGACLNEVDTTDCDRARTSLLAIISALRDTNSLECREQMLQSPAPPFTSSASSSASYSSKRRSPMPNLTPLVSPHSSRGSPSQIQHSVRKRTDKQNAAVKQNDTAPLNRSDSVSSGSLKKADENLAKSVSANIWMPPKPELSVVSERRSVDLPTASRVVTDAAALSDNGSSVRSDEGNSEGAGRSESSTPTARPLNGAAPSPLLSTATRCTLCDVNYDTSFELQVSRQVHLHADHVVMRDGNDFRCPKKHCDKVYPTRENLRLHIAAHYHGGGATPTHESREEAEGALSVLSDLSMDTASVLHRKLTESHPNQHANSAPNHSPGIPEESHTVSSRKTPSYSSPSVVERNAESSSPSSGTDGEKSHDGSIPEKTPGPETSSDVSTNDLTSQVRSRSLTSSQQQRQQQQQQQQQRQRDVGQSSSIASLPCVVCRQCFPDAFSLQQHWLSHVCHRPYVCKTCDAGFITAEALKSHSFTHQNVSDLHIF